MPELPDLQVFSQNLNKGLKGKKLTALNVLNSKNSKASAKELEENFIGQKLTQVYREGKQLRFRFENDAILGMHLMLHGKLFWFTEKNTEKNTIAEFLFEHGKGLALTDYQGLASLSLNPVENDAPDALSEQLSATYLSKKLAATKKQVKDILLDQHIIQGIGNAYADEILWHASISPFSKSNKIPDDKVKDLVAAIKKTLHDAEKSILKHNPDIIAGEVRDFLVIHNSKKDKSPTGEPIKISTKTRKTYYTDEQSLYE
jgi:formamidopyrimidine-DNA glycosylase